MSSSQRVAFDREPHHECEGLQSFPEDYTRYDASARRCPAPESEGWARVISAHRRNQRRSQAAAVVTGGRRVSVRFIVHHNYVFSDKPRVRQAPG